MYHPSRGGVRGGRDQFNWDDVKSDKHRENYIGHSVKAPVGRWQKGKDLTWYARDKKAESLAAEAAKSEIQRIKEDEEQAMREVLGLAPVRERRSQGNRLDKRETAELLKRGKTEEDLAPGYMEGERIQGLGFAPAPRHSTSKSNPLFPGISGTVQERLTERTADSNINISNRDSSHLSDEIDAKQKRKLEKREAKERRKEEKRAAKKAAKKEKRKYKSDDSASDRSIDRKRVRKRHDSSDSDDG